MGTEGHDDWGSGVISANNFVARWSGQANQGQINSPIYSTGGLPGIQLVFTGQGYPQNASTAFYVQYIDLDGNNVGKKLAQYANNNFDQTMYFPVKSTRFYLIWNVGDTHWYDVSIWRVPFARFQVTNIDDRPVTVALNYPVGAGTVYTGRYLLSSGQHQVSAFTDATIWNIRLWYSVVNGTIIKQWHQANTVAGQFCDTLIFPCDTVVFSAQNDDAVARNFYVELIPNQWT